ncbi:RICIN domain-containing protein [Actinoplanes sp. CA-015351]|uniref:RICIN domain-containing protein n=1 Tax=Actinoplanes sp. CA-015351 TaxID=3239897 RepID=UPI003D96C299
MQSGRSLVPAGGKAAIRTTDGSSIEQRWTFAAIGNGLSSQERYVISNAATGQRLAVRNGVVVVEAPGSRDDGALWTLSTTGDGTYTLINVAARRLLDVPGEATADGTTVALWQPTSGGNQRWAVITATTR